MSWYDLNQNKKTTKKEYLSKNKYDNIIAKKANNFNDIIKSELIENVQFRIVTSQSFNAITVLEYLRFNYEVSEMFIVVYRMNQKSVNKLIEFFEDESIETNIVLSSFFRENKRYEKWCESLIQFCKNKNNIKIKFAWNHAKIFMIKTKCGKHIVFEGSGNLSDNARIEQYLIENNETDIIFTKNG